MKATKRLRDRAHHLSVGRKSDAHCDISDERNVGRRCAFPTYA
jgi:hypothetical protein